MIDYDKRIMTSFTNEQDANKCVNIVKARSPQFASKISYRKTAYGTFEVELILTAGELIAEENIQSFCSGYWHGATLTRN